MRISGHSSLYYSNSAGGKNGHFSTQQEFEPARQVGLRGGYIAPHAERRRLDEPSAGPKGGDTLQMGEFFRCCSHVCVNNLFSPAPQQPLEPLIQPTRVGPYLLRSRRGASIVAFPFQTRVAANGEETEAKRARSCGGGLWQRCM